MRLLQPSLAFLPSLTTRTCDQNCDEQSQLLIMIKSYQLSPWILALKLLLNYNSDFDEEHEYWTAMARLITLFAFQITIVMNTLGLKKYFNVNALIMSLIVILWSNRNLQNQFVIKRQFLHMNHLHENDLYQQISFSIKNCNILCGRRRFRVLVITTIQRPVQRRGLVSQKMLPELPHRRQDLNQQKVY